MNALLDRVAYPFQLDVQDCVCDTKAVLIQSSVVGFFPCRVETVCSLLHARGEI